MLYDTTLRSASSGLGSSSDANCTYLPRKNTHGRIASSGMTKALDLRMIAHTRRKAFVARSGRNDRPSRETSQSFAGFTMNERYDTSRSAATTSIRKREVRPKKMFLPCLALPFPVALRLFGVVVAISTNQICCITHASSSNTG